MLWSYVKCIMESSVIKRRCKDQLLHKWHVIKEASADVLVTGFSGFACWIKDILAFYFPGGSADNPLLWLVGECWSSSRGQAIPIGYAPLALHGSDVVSAWLTVAALSSASTSPPRVCVYMAPFSLKMLVIMRSSGFECFTEIANCEGRLHLPYCGLLCLGS